MPQEETILGTLEPLPDGEPILLHKKSVHIGRREDCDIVLNFGNVSGHHARLTFEDGQWYILDLRSRNGIIVDGRRIPYGPRRRLEPDVVFAIAKHEFVIRYESKSNSAEKDKTE
jgi:adenylate cyclase